MSAYWLLKFNEIRKHFLKLTFKEIYKCEFLKHLKSVCNVSTFEGFHFEKLTSIEFIFMDSKGSGGTTVFVTSVL